MIERLKVDHIPKNFQIEGKKIKKCNRRDSNPQPTD